MNIRVYIYIYIYIYIYMCVSARRCTLLTHNSIVTFNIERIQNEIFNNIL
jgi:hypothetical protein